MIEIVRTLAEGDKHLVLRRRDGILELMLGNVPILSSGALETERVFGELAGEAIRLAPNARVLVGGLGFGATLRGVLAVAGADTRILVVEKLAAVIAIARAEASALVAGALDDPRVTVENADVADVIARERDLAAILLDVDNGPEWASFRSNARLYSAAAVAASRKGLREGGVFAVWSGYPKDAFTTELRRAGFSAKIVPLEERGVVRARAYIGTVKAPAGATGLAPKPA